MNRESCLELKKCVEETGGEWCCDECDNFLDCYPVEMNLEAKLKEQALKRLLGVRSMDDVSITYRKKPE